MVHSTLRVWIPEINSYQLRNAIIKGTFLLYENSIFTECANPYCVIVIYVAFSFVKLQIILFAINGSIRLHLELMRWNPSGQGRSVRLMYTGIVSKLGGIYFKNQIPFEFLPCFHTAE